MKDQKGKTTIIIAAYNEEKNISKVLDSLIRAGYYHIIVADDASTDNTAKIVSRYLDKGVILIKHKKNQGQGAMLRKGIEYASTKPYGEYIVTFDADGQHRVEDIERMVRPVAKDICDITLGTRFKGPGKKYIPVGRRIMLKGAVIIQGLFYGVWLTDAHNGFRCFSRKAARKIKITSNRMEHASEIISEIAKTGLRYREVPVIIKYTSERMKRADGGLKRAMKVIWGMIKLKFKKWIKQTKLGIKYENSNFNYNTYI